jgi:hypothetical protein
MEWRLTRAGLHQRRTWVGEGDLRRCRWKVTDGEGVDLDELRASTVLREVVVGLELHGR